LAKRRKPKLTTRSARPAAKFVSRRCARRSSFPSAPARAGRSKVVLVYPAERMNHVTANALLKTLEEPPGDVKFVLATEASHLLLPTIRSRCMGHAMAVAGEVRCAGLAGCPGFSSSRCPRIAAHCRRPARRCRCSWAGPARQPKAGRDCPERWRAATSAHFQGSRPRKR
jgi:DNA polymerase-3 subunit delta'